MGLDAHAHSFAATQKKRTMSFSLFFFSDDGSKQGSNKYNLLLESAKFADTHGFSAVWTPERHFQNFGGLYPNPSVLSAAIAAITDKIGIRAGSVVLPLHHPIRVVEEWSVVDNVSAGRVGISFASGWHAHDFVFYPEKYEQRTDVLFRDLEIVRRLWSGEKVVFQGLENTNIEVQTLPRPVQPQLPTWVSVVSNPQTWFKAGQMGINVLSSLIEQSFDDLASKIQIYRESLAQHGHDPKEGWVTVMLHTFVGEDLDLVREKVRPSLYSYLRTYVEQYPDMAKRSSVDKLVAIAFGRFFKGKSLLGTPETCKQMVDRLSDIGVDEIACLIDFGVDDESVMASLCCLDTLRQYYKACV